MSAFVSFHSCPRLKTLCINESYCNIQEVLLNTAGLSVNDFFVICDGKLISGDGVLHKGRAYHVIPRVLGGKGGFGSMLRAIGAQIEKTTSREACRDLSGRRMRDVNNEKKLKEWIGKQADREQEKEEKRKERIAKRRAQVQHNFDDPTYEDQRGKVLENLEDALQKGLQKAQSKPGPSSTVTSEMMVSGASVRKRKADPVGAVKSKKSRGWLGMNLDELDSDDSAEDSMTNENDTLEADAGICCQEPGTELQEDSKSFKQKKTIMCKTENPDESVDDIKTENSGVHITSQETSQTLKSDRHVGSSEKNKISTVNHDNPLLAALPMPVHTNQEAEIGSKNEKPESTEIKFEQVDLLLFESSSELETLGLDHLKAELMKRGLKCGGTLQQRAERLFAVKGLEQNQIDPSLFSKKSQKGKK